MTDTRKTVGGRREGAGRPATLTDPVRRNINLERRHMGKLGHLMAVWGLGSRSAVIRYLIERASPDRT